MSLDRALLARYLRQLRELGGPELFLERVTAEQLLALAASGGGRAGEHAAPRNAAEARAALRELLGGSVDVPAAGAAPAPSRAGSGASEPEAAASRRAAASAPPEGAVATTRSATSSLPVLATEAACCTRCRLAGTRRHVVFGEGSETADLMVVGEAPGQQEDRTGRPFVGPAGKLLDLLLLSAGFPRDRVYICNVLKCRPPDNRNPMPDEVAACSSFLRGQIEAIGPKVLLAVGKFAAQSLAGTEESIGRMRGRVFSYAGTPLVVTYHPAFLLRSPQWIRTTWDDFQLARKVHDEQA